MLKVNAQLEFKPAEGDVNVERPEGTIRLEELLESLGFSFTDGPGVDRSAPSSVQGRAKDTERETDIKAINATHEAYYAQNGHYPTLAKLNSAIWRQQNMRGLDEEALVDPDGVSASLVTTPIAGQRYGYQAMQCNNQGCQSYILAAILSDGRIYSRPSLNILETDAS